jgi:hypothetical protein
VAQFRHIAALPALALCLPVASHAQVRSATPPDDARVTAAAGYEVHRDRLRYEFENPSTITTPFLVRHRFTQIYEADNQWVVGSARYPLWGGMVETEFGLTPNRDTTASDLDTFFNPGDVVVSGTDGAVSMHALRAAQWSEGRVWGLGLRAGYTYRRDTTTFHSTERIETHTNPPSETRTPIQTHETTIIVESSAPAARFHRYLRPRVELSRRERLCAEFAGGRHSTAASALIRHVVLPLPRRRPDGQQIAHAADAVA